MVAYHPGNTKFAGLARRKQCPRQIADSLICNGRPKPSVVDALFEIEPRGVHSAAEQHGNSEVRTAVSQQQHHEHRDRRHAHSQDAIAEAP